MMYTVRGESLLQDSSHITSWRVWADKPQEAKRKVFNNIRGKYRFYELTEVFEAPEYNYDQRTI